MELETLCGLIGLPGEVTRAVLAAPQAPADILADLRTPGRWDRGREALKAWLGDDPAGLGTLAAHLQCALKTHEGYQKKGIPDEIFAATMKCFPRFVAEHLESYGKYGFDRDFWTVRQLSGVLYRIGELEYELTEGQISLHIPSDARLEPALLRKSWEEARALLGPAPMTCHSWLLSPDLPGLLDAGSRILAFQRNFTIHSPAPDREFRQWVFKDPGLPDEALPEDTALQRSLKRFLLRGGIFHDARGILIDDPFRV